MNHWKVGSRKTFMLSKQMVCAQLMIMLMIDKFSDYASGSNLNRSESSCDLQCQNGGICEWIIVQKQCKCMEGFIGELCQIQSLIKYAIFDTSETKPLLSITFGSGSDQYSNKVPSDFHFTTTYQQTLSLPPSAGRFSFLNFISEREHGLHTGRPDHTVQDSGGYMYFVDIGTRNSEFFKSTVNDLSVGSQYEFSAYMANAAKNNSSPVTSLPDIRFEVRSTAAPNEVLAQLSTGSILEYDELTWFKYGLVFVASTRSVVLFMISNVGESVGNDFVIDDIELRICSNNPADRCPAASLPTIITFTPNAASFVEPLQVRQNQDLYITSKIQFNSTLRILSINYQWAIFICSATCTNPIQLDNTTQKELFIRSRSLSNSIYEVKFTVRTIDDSATLSFSSSSIYIKITSLTIITNLVSFSRSVIKHHSEEILILDPGKYSVGLNQLIFQPQEWTYAYYCRIYHSKNSMQNEEFRLLGDPNQHCFTNRSSNNYTWPFDPLANLVASSVEIFSQSFKSNQTYQFMVHMINNKNPTLQSIGYLFIQIENTISPSIIISCLISTLCSPIEELVYVNQNTQLTLVSVCLRHCSSIDGVRWNVYQGSINSSTNIIQWRVFDQMTFYEDHYLFGINLHNLTIQKDFFIENEEVTWWRFEVIYTFQFETSQSVLDVEMNKGPENGLCTITPSNGILDTVFTITCLNWTDIDQIKDYSFYGWSTDSSRRLMLGFTTESIYQLRLPATIDQTSLNIVVQIRDGFDSMTEFHLTPVTILTNISAFWESINSFQDFIHQALVSGNHSVVGQTISSISYLLNNLHDQNLKTLLENDISPTSFSITSLDNEHLCAKQNSNSFNDAILMDYIVQLNRYADIREQLMNYLANLSISSLNELKFLSSILAQLTQTTNQLTRKTSILGSKKCHELSRIFKTIMAQTSLEDTQLVSTSLLQCAANVITGVNGPLQGRTKVLHSDFNRINTGIIDECSLDDDDDEYQMNRCNQQQTARKILKEVREIISLVTSSLHIHLNVNQSVIINSSSVYFSLEKLPTKLLSNHTIDRIRLPILMNVSNSFVLLRSIIEPLSVTDQFRFPSAMNFSRSLSFSMLDPFGDDIRIQTSSNNSIVFLIPRDPNFILPQMLRQNVTKKNVLFNYHLIDLQENFALHLEIHPLMNNVSYLLIYKFDPSAQSKNTISEIDGWELFCAVDQDEIFTFFIDNNQTFNHHSIVFGIRELNGKEMERFCQNKPTDLPRSDKFVPFSSDYEIRSYLSACSYLNEEDQWQSDGLLVGSLTNHYQTQCFSTHL